MAKETKYGINSFKKDFPTDNACLELLFDTLHSRKCSCSGTYSLIAGRRQYQCSKCRFQIAPTAGTIFHKSSTPLTLWFHAIHVFSNAKSGISAKQMERDLEVTYKTAWRILSLIRKSLKQSTTKLHGDVEMDSAYFGGRRYGGKNNENLSEAVAAKSVVIAAVQRKGNIKAVVVPNNGAQSHKEFLTENVETENTRLITDQTRILNKIALGYDRHSVNHNKKEYVRGDIYVNTIETFWSHVKRSITGTHKVISKKYLQTYLDGFVFHYNNRYNDRERFASLIGILLHA